MPNVTKAFQVALQQIDVPKGKQIAFLQAHFDSPGRASTAAVLANAVGYKNWRPINLHYGNLAAVLGRAMGYADVGLDLLVDFAGPKTVSNEHWILVMRPEFAKALVQVGWVHEA
jgi:hypothetical protein